MNNDEYQDEFERKLIILINDYEKKIAGPFIAEDLITTGVVVVFKSCPTSEEGIEFLVKLFADLLEIYSDKKKEFDST